MHQIFLTFDLEYWFESLSTQKYLHGDEQESLAFFIKKLLNLLLIPNFQALIATTK